MDPIEQWHTFEKLWFHRLYHGDQYQVGPVGIGLVFALYAFVATVCCRRFSEAFVSRARTGYFIAGFLGSIVIAPVCLYLSYQSLSVGEIHCMLRRCRGDYFVDASGGFRTPSDGIVALGVDPLLFWFYIGWQFIMVSVPVTWAFATSLNLYQRMRTALVARRER